MYYVFLCSAVNAGIFANGGAYRVLKWLAVGIGDTKWPDMSEWTLNSFKHLEEAYNRVVLFH